MQVFPCIYKLAHLNTDVSINYLKRCLALSLCSLVPCHHWVDPTTFILYWSHFKVYFFVTSKILISASDKSFAVASWDMMFPNSFSFAETAKSHREIWTTFVNWTTSPPFYPPPNNFKIHFPQTGKETHNHLRSLPTTIINNNTTKKKQNEVGNNIKAHKVSSVCEGGNKHWSGKNNNKNRNLHWIYILWNIYLQ